MRTRFPALLITALLLSGATVVDARVYQWRNPTSGTVEMSGTPPAWYRNAGGGPRILVYENGLLLDDTAIAVDSSLGADLREAAFREFERRQQEEALKRLERAARRERARRREDAEREEAEALTVVESEEGAPSSVAAAVDEIPEILDPVVIDRLKTLLQSWDRQQLGGN